MSADWRQWPLLKPLDRGWRILATGFCFACFGVGGVLLGLTVLPVLYLISADNQQLRRRFQRAVHHSFAFFVWQMKSLGLLTWEVRGLEKLAGSGQLIIANHPSLIDVVFLISLLPETDCVVKQALLVNPFTRPPIPLFGGRRIAHYNGRPPSRGRRERIRRHGRIPDLAGRRSEGNRPGRKDTRRRRVRR